MEMQNAIDKPNRTKGAAIPAAMVSLFRAAALWGFFCRQTFAALPCFEDTTWLRYDPPLSADNAAVKLFVSPAGNNTNPGTIDQPLATIEAARDKLRPQLGPIGGNAIVYIRGGTYNLGQTIVFSNQDGGQNGHKVIYKNYPGDTVFLNAGVAVSGWQKDAGNVYKVHLNEVQSGAWWFRGLYIDGRRGNFKNAETVTYPYNSGNGYTVSHSNASTSATASLCTQAGDWALDSATGTLFYNAGAFDPNTQKIFAEKLTCVIRVLGAIDNKVKNLEFRGFDIMYTYHPFGKGYISSGGGNMFNSDCVRVAVEVEYADSTVLRYLRVAHASGSGIGLGRGATNTLIGHCNIEDMGCDGITMCWTHNAPPGFTVVWDGCGCILRGGPCKPDLVCTWSGIAGNVPMYNTVTDCDIANFSMIYQTGLGIMARHSYGNVLEYNRIVGGNSCAVAACEGLFRFNYNEVGFVVKDRFLDDGGGVYHSTQGGNPPPEFRGNFFHDFDAGSIYLDERGDSAHVYENVSFNCLWLGGMIRLNNTSGHIIENNNTTPTDFQVCQALATTGPRKETPQSPKIISVAATTAYVGCAYSYRIVAATGNPAPAFTASGLPSWLAFNASTATLSGTPPAAGTTGTITITATNSLGSDNQRFTITVYPASRSLDIFITADDMYELFVNGKVMGRDLEWSSVEQYKAALAEGKNVIAVKAVDNGGAAGMITAINLGGSRAGTGTDWKCSTAEAQGWNTAGYDDKNWSQPAVIGAYGIEPWNVTAVMPAGTPAKWIWSPDTAKNTVYFRYVINVPRDSTTGVTFTRAPVTARNSVRAATPGLMLTLGSAQDNVQVSFFDIRGRCVQKVELPDCKSGARYVRFSDKTHGKGAYLYKVVCRNKGKVQSFRGRYLSM